MDENVKQAFLAFVESVQLFVLHSPRNDFSDQAIEAGHTLREEILRKEIAPIDFALAHHIDRA